MDKPKNPICTILWRDASYTFEPAVPKNLPAPTLTGGFIVFTDDQFTNICCSAEYDEKSGKITPKDGFLIPEKTILDFKKVGDLHDNEQ
jgi:hypothetical protein